MPASLIPDSVETAMLLRCVVLIVVCLSLVRSSVSGAPTEEQLARWLRKFPAADRNKDGKLSLAEAETYRNKFLSGKSRKGIRPGAPPKPRVNPGWDAEKFPEHAVSNRTPEEIVAVYNNTKSARQPAVVSYPKPEDGSLRIVGTGHSFMAPGYRTFPRIVAAAGFKQPPLVTHTGGGVTGSTRYKWEQENGIFQFDRKPVPKLLASISNAKWDAMMWGPYFHDRPEYYSCWIDFCLKYNPSMKFYLSDAWPQVDQLEELPESEKELTAETFVLMGEEKNEIYGSLVGELNRTYAGKVFIMPTSDAMVLAAQYYHRGELPGVEGINTFIGGKGRSLWRDRLGHLGTGLGQLEGYVFYATLYGRSPENIESEIDFGNQGDYPSAKLDRVFRKIAWQAVLKNPLSGVVDEDGNGISDDRE